MLNEVVGNYKILDKIGEGGMGEVFKAVDVMLEREVAIKVLRSELAGKSEILERFRKEAVVLAKLTHPNIAMLYNFVHHGDRDFMVMEFAHGQTLDHIIDCHPNGLPWRRSLELFLDALHAIDHAHKLGIVHRDIKPSNMMVNDRDILKVLDFGIARVLGSARLTRAGLLVGTVKYMSPEQIRGHDIDARSDIYSLGIVLYKMLSGRMPFAAEGDFELMRAQIEERPSPLREIVPEVPRAVDDAVLQALAKSPNDRFQTAAEFIDAVGQALREGAGGFVAGAPPWSVRTESVRSKSAPVRPRLDISGNLARAPTEISGLTDRGRRGAHDASAPTEIDIAPESLPASKPSPPLRPRLVEAPVELPPVRSPPDDAPWRQAQQPIKPGATPDPVIRSPLAVERELPAQPPGRRSARIAPQREDPRPTTPASLDETPMEHRAAGRDPPLAAGVSRAGMVRWVFWLRDPRLAIVGLAILLAAGLTIAILNGAFSPPPDPLRIAWLMQRGKEALAAGKMSGPGGDTAATYAEEALRLAPEQVEARKLLADVVARLVEAGESSVKQGELPEAKLHWAEARRLAVKYAAGEEEVATLEKRIVAEEARRAASVRQKEAEEQRRKRIAALIEQGRGALNAGRVRDAVAQAQEVLGLAPESAEARQVLSDAVEGMVKDAEYALTHGDLAAAKTQAQDARALVQQHGLSQAKLADVRARIAQEEQRRAELEPQRREQERQAEQKRVQEAALAARINGLLDQAGKAAAAERWTTPAEDNVVTYAQQILAVSPQHAEARELIAKAVRATAGRGQSALEAGDITAAKALDAEARKLARAQKVEARELTLLSQKIGAAERQEREAEAQKARQAARDTEIQQLIARADRALQENRLTTPAADSAVGLARALRKLQPDHPEAARIASAVIDRYLGVAENASANGNLKQAQDNHKKAQAIAAEFRVQDEALSRLEERIAAEEQKQVEKREALAASAAEKDGSSSDLDNLRAEARAALSANRLTTPGGDNAVEHADRMLRMPAARNEAVQILQEVVGRYVAMGEVALGQGDMDTARGHHKTAAGIVRRYRLRDKEVRQLEKRLLSQRQAPRRPIAPPVAPEPSVTEQESEVAKLRQELERMRREQTASPSPAPTPAPVPIPVPASEQPVGASPAF